MKKTLLLTIGLGTSLLSSYLQAALHIHQAPPAIAKEVQINPNKPELGLIEGRARSQRLESALKNITHNKMDVEFVNPELKEMKINWRANGEPMQIILTQLSRGYQVDISINEPKETVYINVDTGQCDAVRERSLLKTKKMWESLNLSEEPILPPRLISPIGHFGHEYRLC
ncbi:MULTISPECIES: hypothetical protein [Vibrio]|uniref:Toxin co-regulated pilus biosynthesis protein Q C-terminal domain-containing protein n=1 Tax=Vibrio tasmaniensis TaxID=212663 RepID=A0A2N7NND1_9VIBR|nr:hypothetical protein [Vibrio tasmaniensis]PMO80321.1 hypothetical protein BCT01_08500 [Vibrio tasmaniensis]PMP17811.1 hypothetical protein BCS92_05230 [Vibrio tasmaniensis]TKG29016.1 hypothetical protein FC057_20230 [Vibrio tasmaniensis]TKG41585.1 hypothetical protein FC063_06920 [Vibrio tasmaniensis]TKG46234.1 hypothetical protein FC070_22385 [Vibrio tasmaniensis]